MELLLEKFSIGKTYELGFDDKPLISMLIFEDSITLQERDDKVRLHFDEENSFPRSLAFTSGQPGWLSWFRKQTEMIIDLEDPITIVIRTGIPIFHIFNISYALKVIKN